jgi:hypothetical protein
MIQMTTPVHVFSVDVDLTEAPEVSVTYKQRGAIVLQLNKDDIEITTTEIRHTFTQEESGKFRVGDATAQIKAILTDGTVISHKKPVEIMVHEIYDKRVFSDAE